MVVVLSGGRGCIMSLKLTVLALWCCSLCWHFTAIRDLLCVFPWTCVIVSFGR